MTNHINGTPLDDPFSNSPPTRIADISPSIPGQKSNHYIEAVVALIWPYSSSTRVLSLLLAEPNIRLRSGKGQVKVIFHSGSAKEVARSQVGIGDLVRLRLSDAEWTKTGDVVSTPGKKIDWDLTFKNRVVLDVSRDGRHLAAIYFEGADTPPPTQNDGLQTPAQIVRHNSMNGTIDDLSIRLASPTTLKAKRVSSGSFLDASLDPFADDDGFVAWKGRKRTKFARHSGSWKLLEKGESPEQLPESSPIRQQTNGHDVESEPDPSSVERLAVETAIAPAPVIIELDNSPSPETTPRLENHTTVGISDKEPAHASMPPPSKPLRRLPESLTEIPPSAQDFTKPRLHPLASPGLPLVSPLLQDFGPTESYFSDDIATRSELDGSTDQPHGNDRLPIVALESSELENIDDSSETPSIQAPSLDCAEQGLEPAARPQSDMIAAGVTGQALDDSIFQTGEEIFEEMQELQEVEEPRMHAETDIYEPVRLLQNFGQQSVEQDEEDMYGSTELLPSTPTETNKATADLLEAVDLTWQERLDVTAVESKIGDSYSAPISSFQQNWQKKKAKIRPFSNHSLFLDGASDEMSGSELSSEQDVDEVLVEQPPADAEAFEQTTEELPESPLLEIAREDSVELVEIIESQTPTTVPSLIDPSIVGQYTQEQFVLEELSANKDLARKPSRSLPDEASVLRGQLRTPDNTQGEHHLAKRNESLQEIPQQMMPPTPENTQEQGVELPQINATNDLRFTGQEDVVKALIPTAELKSPPQPQPIQRSPALQDLAKISSPYFTPRRSTRLTPDLHSTINHEQRTEVLASKERETHRRTRSGDPQQTAKAATADSFHRVAPGIASKAALKVGLTTPLSYYVPLSKLSEYYNQQIDVFAICTATSDKPIQARSGPKDYNVTLHLVDSSLTGNITITAQIFRPYKLALPIVQRADAVLFRSVKVQSQKRKCMLLSTNSSAWAIFPAGNAEKPEAVMAGLQIEIPGPPLEYGPEEVAYAAELMSWWEEEGAECHHIPKGEKGKEAIFEEAASTFVDGSAKERTKRQSTPGVVRRIAKQHSPAEPNPKQPEPARTTRVSRRLANRTDNIDNDNHDAPLSSSPPPANSRSLGNRHSRSISSVSVRSSSLEPVRQSRRSESVVHELRDGTKYVDHEILGQERARRKKDGNVVHELRGGATWVDE